eukprot:NODE_19740_length_829_cov_5.236467.p1 GENE.NODE_19740_length_829_cov_5.236467~~NODE_19740_length_829_cov_5.236467.p1  ORF type:complete len:197 (+),score=14.49 NODE_19740_length_829_cov_5.236467:83-673(+)
MKEGAACRCAFFLPMLTDEAELGMAGRDHLIWGSLSSARREYLRQVATTVVQVMTSGETDSSGESHSINSGASAAPSAHALHELGRCKPCRNLTTQGGCRRGDSCLFCHESHDGMPLRPRPCKKSRMKCKQLANNAACVEATLAAADPNPQSQRGRYLRMLLMRRQHAAENPAQGDPPAGIAPEAVSDGSDNSMRL